MPSRAFISTGITIAFGTTGFSVEILDVNPEDRTRESVNTSHMGTVGSHTHAPVDLVEPGELTFDVHYDPDVDVPIDQPAETIVITYPNVANTTLTFEGFITGVTNVAPFEDKMTGTITIKKSGPQVTDPGGAGSGSGSFA